MKCVIIFAILATVLFLETECTSPVNCKDLKCNKSECPSVEHCKCGSYQDQCGCCSYCNKCPGQECSLVAGDRCSEGYVCKSTGDPTRYDSINKPGICVETK